MATKSLPPVNTREMIGEEAFNQRRDMFHKHDTGFAPSPTTPTEAEVSTHFRRNTPGYSSMKETRKEEVRIETGFRERKYSDNFTSENQSDDVEYRHYMTERTRRLSKLRREFLTSNLHEPSSPVFTRVGARASLPVRMNSPYKIESPNLYKFPFAEPFSTPTPIRKPTSLVTENEVEKENEDPLFKNSNLTNAEALKADHHKFFEELLKRYSPQRKPINWSLPPTKPRVVGVVPKVTSNSLDAKHTDIQAIIDVEKNSNDPNFINANVGSKDSNGVINLNNVEKNFHKIEAQAVEREHVDAIAVDASDSFTDEKNDKVGELADLKRNLNWERKSPRNVQADLTIPALIDKINKDGEEIEHHKNDNKKVKRKRSFLDKLFGRKKNKNKAET